MRNLSSSELVSVYGGGYSCYVPPVCAPRGSKGKGSKNKGSKGKKGSKGRGC